MIFVNMKAELKLYMKKSLLYILMVLFGFSGFSQEREEEEPGNLGREHSLPGLAGALEPADRQHRHQGGGRRRVARPQAWWCEAPSMAQDPHWRR